jgi:hypothetical protein
MKPSPRRTLVTLPLPQVRLRASVLGRLVTGRKGDVAHSGLHVMGSARVEMEDCTCGPFRVSDGAALTCEEDGGRGCARPGMT